MNTYSPREPLLPSIGPAQPHSDSADEIRSGTEDLSSIAMVCDGILASLNALPDCPDATKMTVGARIGMILSMFSENELQARKDRMRITALKCDLRRTKEQLAVLRQEHFGQSSEKDRDGEPDIPDDGEDEEEEESQALVRKGKRTRRVPADIPIREVHHYPDGMNCCSCGCEMKTISSWASTRLVTIPEHVEAIRDIYHTCACNRSELCKENKPMAARSNSYIMHKRSIDPQLIAEAAVQKFFEHIPTYRMARRMKNAGVNLSTQTISNNIIHVAGFLAPIVAEFVNHVKSGHAPHMDETPLRVLAPGKGKCDTGYIWVVCRDERRWNPEARPAVIYEYAPSRAGAVAREMLADAAIRFLHTDGYGGYNGVRKADGANDGIDIVRCWAHARRKFHEAHIATKSPLAARIVKLIKKMYKVEATITGLPPEEREARRQDHSLPVLNEIHAVLTRSEAVADGALKQAIKYTLKAFDGLRRFVFDGRLEIDNNPVERCIRGIALTKKNSLFAGNHETAKVWAIYYTLIESARLNSIDPRRYLSWVIGEIERTHGDIDYGTLMPWHCPVGRLSG
ncbi:IS66 family transposase [Pseudogemmobacter bohemicus]|uniref:IS66 family transposase n=1 Tax=Pseudogemmobacter bohemicus TaxID=2250708 RepID=UPI001300AA87|nr:IS66 family transposase [Pseudogemmobacter bohemicus]